MFTLVFASRKTGPVAWPVGTNKLGLNETPTGGLQIAERRTRQPID